MKHRVVKYTDKFEMSRAPIVKSSLITDNNEIGAPSVKYEDENPPKIVESTRRYPLRKTNPPPCLADYVTKSKSEDLVIMSIFVMF